MGRLSQIACTIGLLFAVILSADWIFGRQWYWFTNAIYLIEYANGTGGFAIDVTNFMHGMWLLSILAIIVGFVIGYVYGSTKNKT